MRALGQQSDLVRHHRKSTALFPGAGRFNRGVQRQQVGLFGNRADHFKHTADLAALRGQCLYHFDRLIDGAGQLPDLLQAAIDVLLAKPGLRLGTPHFAGGVFGVFRHLLYGVGDFVDGSRHLVHLQGLLLAALLGVRGVAAHFSG